MNTNLVARMVATDPSLLKMVAPYSLSNRADSSAPAASELQRPVVRSSQRRVLPEACALDTMSRARAASNETCETYPLSSG